MDKTDGIAQSNSHNWIDIVRERAPGLVMIGSWFAGFALCCLAIVSPKIGMRFVSVFMFGLMLAPTLVLAFRQVERERHSRALREQNSIGPDLPEQSEFLEEEQSGIFVDQPTGLASRRYLNMFLKRELSRSERGSLPLSLAVFDVDDFQKLQADTGARAVATGLADVGARLKSALRDYDLVARYADGRLAVVLPDTTPETAAEVVDRLHGLATSVCVEGKQLAVTVGMAAFPEHGSSPDEIINSAHRALNRGKAECANSVHTMEDLPKAA